MSRDEARTFLESAKVAVEGCEQFSSETLRHESYMSAIAHALIALAEVQLDQLEVARRVRTK